MVASVNAGDEEKQLGGVLGLLFAVGARRRPPGVTGFAARVLALGTACYVLYATLYAILDPLMLVAIFLSPVLALLFLTVAHRSRVDSDSPPLIDILASILALAVGIYFLWHGDTLIRRISLLDPLTPLDVFMGTAVWVLTLEATRRTVGLGLALLVMAMIAYNLFGDHLGGVLRHGHISYEHFLDQTVFTTNGVFGAPLRVAATYAFLFVLFGTLLQHTGGSDFFFKIAAAVSGRQVGGPAKVSILSSALYGTISGSPTSDVVTTGSVTIPLMRRLGYSRTLSGAIEVASSPAGGLIPPVMGAAAFIMVEVTGIPYVEIAQAAILPALLYLLAVYVQVHFLSHRMNIGAMDPSQIPSLGTAMRDGGLFVVPLIAIVVALSRGYSISFVAVIGVASVLAVAMLRQATRPGLMVLLETLIVTTQRMVPVAAACAAAGLVVGGISMTGLSGKLAIAIFTITGDSIFIALLVSAVIAILLGMGMPTPSAYIMSAVLIAPVLIELGMPLLNVHFFLLFFAVLSAITPPVAVAAYAAASLAEANPIAIAMRSCSLAAPAFVLPFIFVNRAELLGQGSPEAIALTFLTCAVGVSVMAIAGAGYFRSPLNRYIRLLLMVAGLCLMFPGVPSDVVGFVIVVVSLYSGKIVEAITGRAAKATSGPEEQAEKQAKREQ